MMVRAVIVDEVSEMMMMTVTPDYLSRGDAYLEKLHSLQLVPRCTDPILYRVTIGILAATTTSTSGDDDGCFEEELL